MARLRALPRSSYISELLILPQDIDGTVLPAVQGDNLDITESSKPKQTDHVVLAAKPLEGNAGFSLFQKLIFFGIIVGIVAMFFKYRSTSPVAVEKFPA